MRRVRRARRRPRVVLQNLRRWSHLKAVVALFAILLMTAALGPSALLMLTRPNSLVTWGLVTGAAFAVVLFTVVAGPWVFLSVYARPVALMAFAAGAAVSFCRRVRTSPDRGASGRNRSGRVASAIVLVTFSSLTVAALLGQRTPAGAVDLQLPFKSGTFAVLQGGDSFILNPFHRAAADERFALDFVRVNSFGNRACGLSPGSLNAYESFGVPVFSPCAGVIERAVGELPDNLPGNTDRRHPAGNHIVLHCQNLRVLVAHLRKGSVGHRAGAQVYAGQLIGEIGNSGNTLEPHLHVSAAVAANATGPEGRTVPLTFGGRFLTLNDTVRLRAPRTMK